MDREAARALNCLAREPPNFLGSADGPALADFLQDYFCGDDPVNDSQGKSMYFYSLPHFTCLLLLR